MYPAMDYLKDPDAIYQRSFAIIAHEVDLSRFPGDARRVAERLIHACGMPDILTDVRIDPGLVLAVRRALDAGRPILADCEMVRAAIMERYLPERSKIICTLNDPRAANIGKSQCITRSSAAVRLWGEHLDGAIVVIGNAPTALFGLLELLDGGAPKPAAILGFPVGFVGAAESKAELHTNPRGCPYATLLGRRGGSAMAGAALNAIAIPAHR